MEPTGGSVFIQGFVYSPPRIFLLQAANTIQVWNNGFGVPVDVHKEEGVYIPEMIFGHLLTSSNYDDDEKKASGTRDSLIAHPSDRPIMTRRSHAWARTKTPGYDYDSPI